jgi:hypothetical protein
VRDRKRRDAAARSIQRAQRKHIFWKRLVLDRRNAAARTIGNVLKGRLAVKSAQDERRKRQEEKLEETRRAALLDRYRLMSAIFADGGQRPVSRPVLPRAVGHWLRFRKPGEAAPPVPAAGDEEEEEEESPLGTDRSEPLSDRPDGTAYSPLKRPKPLPPFLVDLASAAVIPVGTKVRPLRGSPCVSSLTHPVVL